MHEYQTKINLLKGEKYFRKQIRKYIKERMAFDTGYGFILNVIMKNAEKEK